MEGKFSAMYQRSGDWWVASLPEIPGAHSQGRTLEEARENLQDAVELLLQVRREMAEEGLEGAEVIREEFVITAA